VGLAIVTVPLTTLAVSSLQPKDMPQGAALNNMMRQLGGSFGIAMVNTFLADRNASHRADIVAHITTDNPFAVQRLAGYANYFARTGATPFEAHAKAIKLLDNIVVRQAGMLSFGDAYLLLGFVFAVALPVLLLARKRKGRSANVVLSDH
jgi:DHA2 family multidrug resistance protein